MFMLFKKTGETKMKGQVDLLTLVAFFIAVIVFVTALLPTMTDYTSDIVNNDTYDAPTRAIFQFTPLLFFVALIIGLFYYAFGRRQWEAV